jgi:hypothetical protein
MSVDNTMECPRDKAYARRVRRRLLVGVPDDEVKRLLSIVRRRMLSVFL